MCIGKIPKNVQTAKMTPVEIEILNRPKTNKK